MATLELGAQIPGWHWDWSVAELRDFAQGAEAIGFDWLGMTDDERSLRRDVVVPAQSTGRRWGSWRGPRALVCFMRARRRCPTV